MVAPILLTLATSFIALSSQQQILSDPGVAGPELEIVHLYNDEWPTGVTVARNGRKFSNYPPGLDPNNTNTGTNNKYTVAELLPDNNESPYPSAEINNPPGGSINYTVSPPVGANYQNYLIGVQSVVLDAKDRLWILDTGRALTADGVLVPASVGGAKLVGVDIESNEVLQTIVFPDTVAYPTSYLNDVRFDLRSNLSGTSGKGVAYITDSSLEGRNGIIIVDLGSGESWRHLDGTREVRPDANFVPFIWGTAVYSQPAGGMPLTTVGFGTDGIALSADGSDLYFGTVGGRNLHSIPTERLRDRSLNSELLARASVVQRGNRGTSDGFETDTNGYIYMGNMEDNAVIFYNPRNASVETFVRDPRISWADTLSVASDGYLYFTNNQLWRMASFYPGTDRRVKPFALMRARLPGNAIRVDLQ